MKRTRLLAICALAAVLVLALCSAAWAAPDTSGNGKAKTQLTVSAQGTVTTGAPAQEVANGTYLIQTKLSKWQMLDVAQAGTADRTNIQIWRSNMTGAQKWKITYDKASGFYTIQNVGSKKYLDVAGGVGKSGTNVQQYHGNGTKAQLWKISKNSDGSFTIAPALNGKLALDVAQAGTENGTNVRIWNANKTPAQSWRLISTKVSVAPGENLKLSGWYTVVPAAGKGAVLDVAQASVQNGANIQAHRSNKTLAQLYSFEYKNGYYRIVNARSQKPLTAVAGNLVSGTNVVSSAGSGNSQLFAAKKNADGTVTFINKANGMALALAANAKGDDNIVTASPNGSTAQRFKLTKAEVSLPETVVTISPVYSSRVLDIANGSFANGANVQLYNANGTFAQKWRVYRTGAGTYRFQALVSGKYLGLSGNNVTARIYAKDGSQEWKVSIANGGYVLTNKKTGKALDVANGANAKGVNIQTYARNGAKAQSFLLNDTPVIPDGTYVIMSALDNSKVLDVSGGSLADRANIQLYPSNNLGPQKFYVTRNANGTYQIVNAQSGKALDVAGGSGKSGTNVQQYRKNGTLAQQWVITYDGCFKIGSALNPSIALDVANGQTVAGNNIRVWRSNDTLAQRWNFAATTYDPMTPAQRAMFNRAQGFSSSTSWLILVNCTTNYTGIFRGSQGNWTYEHYWICSTGAPDSPTVKGTFTIYDRYGSFGEHYTCWWPTRFYGPYLFHSVLYNPGSNTSIQDGRLGQNVSQGCVRLPIEQAKWIHDVIPDGTKVFVY